MTCDTPLRMAVIGAGAMGQGHCKTVQEWVPEFRLTAIVDADAETAARVGMRFGVPSFTHVDDLCATECADAVLVAVPHPLHGEIVETCMRAGLHVLCEKPLAETVSAVDRMLRCARETGRVFGIMLQRRFEPALAAAIDFTQAGGLGAVMRALLIVPMYRTQYYYDSNPWRATWQGEGGGVLLNQAPHLLDILALTAGMPSSLRGRSETRLHDIEVEDHAEATLRFPGGGTGYLCCTTCEPMHGDVLEVVGERGRIYFHHDTLECCSYPTGLRTFTSSSREVWAQPPIPAVPQSSAETSTGHCSVMRNFARHILYGEPLRCDAQSGLASLELANAITLSSFTGEEVTLPVDRNAYDALLQHLREASVPRKHCHRVERVTDPRFS